MARHKVYFAILDAIKTGRLKEPFGSKEFCTACPGFAEGTYTVFLNKHTKGNPCGNSELFLKIDKGTFKLLRPFKYID